MRLLLLAQLPDAVVEQALRASDDKRKAGGNYSDCWNAAYVVYRDYFAGSDVPQAARAFIDAQRESFCDLIRAMAAVGRSSEVAAS